MRLFQLNSFVGLAAALALTATGTFASVIDGQAEVCLTFGVSDDPCVSFTDDEGDGWFFAELPDGFDIKEFQTGDRILVSGDICFSCIQTFCGSFEAFFVSNVTISECPTGSVAGDMNSDDVVDGNDLLMLLNQWGRCNGCIGDMNTDGKVDGSDLLMLLNNWG